MKIFTLFEMILDHVLWSSIMYTDDVYMCTQVDRHM